MNSKEFVHSWFLLMITFFTLIFMLANNQLLLDVPLLVFGLYLCFRNGLRLKGFYKYAFYAFLFSSGLFLLNIFYPGKNLQNGEVVHFYAFTFYAKALSSGLHTMLKLFAVSFFSMAASSTILYTKVILYLIVRKFLGPIWGYPILLAMNSIALFKEEMERIQINAKFRDLPLKDRIFTFFPLLVFAIRHSQRGALSLVTRGLQEDKSFYFTYFITPADRLILFFFFVLYLVLVVLAIYPLR